MSKLPITLLLFLTSRGHFGSRTLYRSALLHLDRQIPLASFGTLYAHIKVAPGEEAAAELIQADLKQRGFIVETATAPWVRGQVHFEEYLKDQVKVSKDPRIYGNPYVWMCDDDSPIVTHKDPLLKVLYRMTSLIESSPDVLSSRFLRREDRNPGLDVGEMEPDLFYCRDFNFQLPLLRARDYHRACKVIEDNWGVAKQMHIEAVWREVLAPFSRSDRKHAVWLPDYAETKHIGVADYQKVCSELNLPVYPNP